MKALFTLLFFSLHLIGYEYQVAICSFFKNEAPYLKEWIDFHRAVGVEHFFLYNHESTDSPLDVLQPYIDAGIVEVTNWKTKSWRFGQVDAFDACLAKTRKSVKWLALLDCDEFLFPLQANSLQEFLVDYENFGGVAVNWQMYGTSFIKEIPSGETFLDKLILKAPRFYSENHYIKSIVRPERVSRNRGPHCFYYLNGFFAVDTNKRKVDGMRNALVPIDKIRINHYWTRDEKYAYTAKLERRRQWDSLSRQKMKTKIDKFLSEANKEEDTSIFRFFPLMQSQNENCVK